MYVHTCVTYEVTGINHVTRSNVYIFCKLHFILMAYITKKYDCHIAHIVNNVFILYERTKATASRLSFCKQNPQTKYESNLETLLI